MKTSIFTDFDKRMGIIPRWTIVHTIQKQSVAEHCFNVERIATNMARLWFDVKDEGELYRISQWALHHDDLEAVTGDIQSPVKPLFDEISAEMFYPEIKLSKPELYIKHIVKLADIMEWVVFAAYEVQLGNAFIADFYEHHRKSVVDFAQDKFGVPFWADLKIPTKVRDWLHEMASNPPKLMDFGRRM